MHQCNGPGFDPGIRRYSGIWGAAEEAVLNIVQLTMQPDNQTKQRINQQKQPTNQTGKYDPANQPTDHEP
jgi:hypothetical protein